MTFGDIFSEINLDSSIIYVIILTNLIFIFKLDFDHVTADSSLMDRLLDLSKK
jgi:hypothetical protein